jgi:hypothetical protein
MTGMAMATLSPRPCPQPSPCPASRIRNPRIDAGLAALVLALALGWLAVPGGASAQVVFRPPFSLPTLAQGQGQTQAQAQGPETQVPGRQVTLFGVIAVPNDPRIDPKLARIEPQLRKLLPGYGFRLLGVQSKRLTVNESLACPLGDGYTAAATLMNPFDENGKVQLRCSVLLNQMVQLESQVSTPPNQLFFSDKLLANGSRLLIGVGAR